MVSMNQLIRLGSWQNARQFETVAVLDLSADGTLLGLEVLQASIVFGDPAPRSGSGVVAIRIDRVADAMYVRFVEAPSARQDVCAAVFYVDPDNVLVGIEFERAPRRAG
jgi:hypothetical protein